MRTARWGVFGSDVPSPGTLCPRCLQFGLFRHGSLTGTPLHCELLTPLGQLTRAFTVALQPHTPTLDARGKAVFHVSLTATASDDGSHGAPSTAAVMLVVSCASTTSVDGGSGAAVVPVVSTPMRPCLPSAGESAEDTSASSWHEFLGANCRLFPMPHPLPPIILLECHGVMGVGGRMWDAGIVLLRYLCEAKHAHIIQGHRVVELGAGTGIVGLAAARLGAASVVLTDLTDVCPLLTQNVALCGAQAVCTVEPLLWGAPLSPALACTAADVDVILAADVVYEPECFEALVTTMLALSRSATRVRVCACVTVCMCVRVR